MMSGDGQRRCLFVTAMAATLLIIVAIVLSFASWTIADPALRLAVIGQIERASGLSLTADGRMTLRLLPRPTVQLGSVSIAGEEGAVALDAEVMTGRLDLLALLGGHIRVVAAAFERPTATLDLDRLLPLAGAFDRSSLLGLLQTGGLTLHGGVIRLRSAERGRDALLTDLSATFEWPADDAEARLSGTATWRGVTGEIIADVARPGSLAAAGQTLASFRLRSSALDMDAHGNLQGSGESRATGRLTASTTDLPGFLRLIGMPAPQLEGVQAANITATAKVAGDMLSLDDVSLSLDDMLFEGALAVRQRGDRTSLAGTLASDRVDLDPFLRAVPAFGTTEGGWSDHALNTRAVADDDIDLRVSAASAKLGAFTIEDGSFSLQSGDGRMELSLGEARTYDGLVKGRIVATADGRRTGLRADLTVSRLDLEKLFKDVPGEYRAAGLLSGHVAVETAGTTPADLARTLQGRGEMSLRSGAIGDRLMMALLHPAASANPATLPSTDGSLPLDGAAIVLTGDAGHLTLGDSWIAWPAGRAAIGGGASIPDQTLDLHASVTAAEASEADAGFTIVGPWRNLQLAPERPRF